MDSYNDDNVPIDDTAGDVDWVNSEQDLINCEESDAVSDDVSDMTDIPVVDDSEATDDSYPDNPGDTPGDFRTDEPDMPGGDYTDTPDATGNDRIVEPDTTRGDYTDTPDATGDDRVVEPDTTRDDFSDRPEVITNQSLDTGSSTPPDGAASVEVSTDTPVTPPAQDLPQAGKPATDSQTETPPDDDQRSSGSYLRGGMDQIATTELGEQMLAEGVGIEAPERIYFNNVYEREERRSGGPERMG